MTASSDQEARSVVRSDRWWSGRAARAVVVLLGTLCSLGIAGWEWYHSRLMPKSSPWKHVLAGIYSKGHTTDATIGWLLPVGLLFMLCWWHVVRFRTRYSLWTVLLLWALPQFLSTGGDMYNYAEQGWALLHGADPTLVPSGTVHGPFQHWGGIWTGTTVGYPVLALSVSALAVRLGGATPMGTMFFLHLWAALGLFLVAWSLPRIGRHVGLDGRWLFALIALNPMVLEYQLGQGHHDTLAAGLGLLGLWCWLRWWGSATSWILATLLLCAAAGLKQPALVFPLVAAGALQLKWAHEERRRLPWAQASRPSFRQRLAGLGKSALWTLPLWAAPLFAIFVLPYLVGFGTGWLSSTGKPGGGSLPIPRIIQLAIDVQRVKAGEHIIDPAPLLHTFLLVGAVLYLLVVLVFRLSLWTSLVWTGLAAQFLFGSAYFPWYGIWVLVPLLLSSLSWRGKAVVVTVMSASSVFPIFHGPGVVSAYLLAAAAAAGAGVAVWLVLRKDGAPEGRPNA